MIWQENSEFYQTFSFSSRNKHNFEIGASMSVITRTKRNCTCMWTATLLRDATYKTTFLTEYSIWLVWPWWKEPYVLMMNFPWRIGSPNKFGPIHSINQNVCIMMSQGQDADIHSLTPKKTHFTCVAFVLSKHYCFSETMELGCNSLIHIIFNRNIFYNLNFVHGRNNQNSSVLIDCILPLISKERTICDWYRLDALFEALKFEFQIIYWSHLFSNYISLNVCITE